MTTLRANPIPGFDELLLKREPLEVTDNGVFREFIAGPFMDFHARRGGVKIDVRDWPASKDAPKLLDILRSAFDLAEAE
jgi:hypothetical protein